MSTKTHQQAFDEAIAKTDITTMFSKPGKQTNFQYICFQTQIKKQHGDHYRSRFDKEDEHQNRDELRRQILEEMRRVQAKQQVQTVSSTEANIQALPIVSQESQQPANASTEAEKVTETKEDKGFSPERQAQLMKGCTSSFRVVARDQIQESGSRTVNMMAHIGFKYYPKSESVMKRIAADIKLRGRGETIFSQLQRMLLKEQGEKPFQTQLKRKQTLDHTKEKISLQASTLEKAPTGGLNEPPLIMGEENNTSMLLGQKSKSKSRERSQLVDQTYRGPDNKYFSYGVNLRSPVKMDKGSKRRSIFEDIKGPNEKRFEPIYVNPKILAKYVNHDGPDFKRYTKHQPIIEGDDSSHRKKPMYEKHPMSDYWRRHRLRSSLPYIMRCAVRILIWGSLFIGPALPCSQARY